MTIMILETRAVAGKSRDAAESRSEVIQGHTFWRKSKARVPLYI